MLTEILSNFSEDELLEFIPSNAINFTLEIDDYNKDIERSSFNKNHLARVVASVKQVEFIFEKLLRTKLIERLSHQQIVELFPSFNLQPSQVTPSHYDAIISWSEENLEQFAAVIGLSKLYENQLAQN
ncbi:hypothetical protein EAY83_21895, partial [Vibrio anguillarum]